MTLPLQYSQQESLLKPKGVKDAYIRLQVKLRPEQTKVTISDKDYEILLQSLAEGRLVGLETESGIKIGQFQTSLTGAYLVSEFTSPSTSDMKVSFKPTLQFLNNVRQKVSFKQVPTVIHNPQISRFTFTGTLNGIQTVYTNQIPLNTGGVLKIIGANFIKQGMTVEVMQFVKANGKKAAQTLNMPINSGKKGIEILISNDQFTDKDFDTGETPSPSYTRIVLTQSKHPIRSSSFDFEFIASLMPHS